MIIKIDHLAVAPTDFKKELLLWKKRGWHLKFIERHVPNLRIKKEFMHRFAKLHTIAFFEGNLNFNIELIDHGHVYDSNNSLVPQLRKVKREYVFRSIFVSSHVLEKSFLFWEALGFSTKSVSKNFTAEFKSPFHRVPLKIHIRKRVKKQQWMLDDGGYNCISFVSTSAPRERNRLRSLGYATTPLERIPLNGKTVTAFFVSGPSGELAEIISIT